MSMLDGLLRHIIRLAGVDQPIRKAINFGAGLSVADDPEHNQLTVSATGGDADAPLSESDGIAFTSDQTKTRSILTGQWPTGDLIAHLHFTVYTTTAWGDRNVAEYTSCVSRESGTWAASSGAKLGAWAWTAGGGDPFSVTCAGGGPPAVSATGWSCAATTLRWRVEARIEALPLTYSADPIA